MCFDILLLFVVLSLHRILVLIHFRFFLHALLSDFIRLLGLIPLIYLHSLRFPDAARGIIHRNYYTRRLYYQKPQIDLRYQFLGLVKTNFLGSHRQVFSFPN